jgi:hypothetical protein
MPDRPEGDHRSTRSRTSLNRSRTSVLLVALLVLAASAALVPAAPAATKRSDRPTVSSFSFSPATFAPGQMLSATRAKRATTIRFRLSERSKVTIRLARKLSGRRSGRRCVKSTARLRSRPACSRYVGVGALVRTGQKAGQRALAFSGRLRGRALPRGNYRATIRATDRTQNKSRLKTARFTVGAGQQSQNSSPTPSPTPAGPGIQRRVVRPCSVTLPNVTALASVVASAAPGSVVCLAPGNYGRLSLSARPAGEVVVQPAGTATIAGATLGGSNLTLEGFNVTGAEVTVQPGSDHITVQFNRISGGYFGIDAGPTTTTTVNDVTIRANKFVGNFGEDAIRLNRYHDGPDADPYGALIEGNEITGVIENGEHNDCLQTVWVGDHLYIRRNYLHDNNCQGFFVKDQASAIDTIVIEDNLLINHDELCQPESLCPNWVLSPIQVFGPLTSLRMANNTIWTPFRNGGVYARGSGWGSFEFVNNVVYRLDAPDGSAPFSSYSASNNTTCNRTGWPATGVTTACSAPFPNPAAGDYRLGNGRGVTWAPAEQQYGP